MKISALQLFLDRLTDRSALNIEEREAILSLKTRPAQAGAHVDIVSPGEITDHACLIVSGLAGRFGQLHNGMRQITALHLPGDMCDLHSLVRPKVGWSLQALAPTMLLHVSHQDLRRLAQAYPAIAEAFWRDCVVDASILSQWVVNVGRRDARTRLGHLLCELAVRMEQIGLGSRRSFTLLATQTQLGDALGLTAVHVNRVMQTLRREGLIATQNREIIILDWDRLVRLGDFDSGYLENSGERGAVGVGPDRRRFAGQSPC